MIQIQKRDRDYAGYMPNKPPVWRTVSRKGKLYSIGDEVVELFTFRVICEAIDRLSPTVKLWEKEGKFPKPLYDAGLNGKPRSGSDVPNRYYSSTQVVNLNNLFVLKYLGLKKLNMNGPHGQSPDRLQRFIDDILIVFYERKVLPNAYFTQT
jgi:hypothetical protein